VGSDRDTQIGGSEMIGVYIGMAIIAYLLFIIAKNQKTIALVNKEYTLAILKALERSA
jgi:hypothetical protein